MIKKDKAFTLVELLVVVSVLALLASIVFSNLTGAREQAKISNILAFQSQVHNLMGSDLIGWWNFDEGTGSVAKDSSGYGNDGTIVGATRVDGIPGAGGKALEFNGSNSYVDLGKDNILTTDLYYWSMSIWAKPATEDLSGMFSFQSGSNWRSSIYGNNLWRTRKPDGGTADDFAIPIIEGEGWVHFVFSFDGNNGVKEIYENGVSVARRTSLNHGVGLLGLSECDGNFIGRAVSQNYYYTGLIDDVRIYSRALTAYEVQTLYAQTKDNYLAEEQ